MREVHILNLGADVQSTTLYLMACAGEIHFDVAIFADTQDEPQVVYRHLEWPNRRDASEDQRWK
jgi:hypothetical protein